MEKGINVLSLFDGMSCGQIALQRAGIKVNQYYASEIDTHAIRVTQHNHPKTIQLGSVTEVCDMFLPEIDLLIGGSPCQGFSFAGKQLNFEDPRSKLFFEFVRLKEELNPSYFLLENVKMKKEYQDIISKYLGVEPIEINSALVSAQSRKRLYWSNIPGIQQPEDLGLLLRDILEDHPFDKTATPFNTNPSGNGMNGKIYLTDKKSPCLTTNKGEGVKISFGAGRIVGRKINPVTGKRDDSNKAILTVQRFEFNSDPQKTNCLTTVQKDNVLKPVLVGRSNSSQDGKIVSPEGKSYCHTAGNNNTPKVSSGILPLGGSVPFRKLTPVECERLQTVPDNYSSVVSNSQRYKMLGNGWTVDVIAHIFKNLPYATVENNVRQLEEAV